MRTWITDSEWFIDKDTKNLIYDSYDVVISLGWVSKKQKKLCKDKSVGTSQRQLRMIQLISYKIQILH